MSTPVLIHPKTGEVVLNVTSGPAPAEYRGKELDGATGALTKFQEALGTRRNRAFNTYNETVGEGSTLAQKVANLKKQYAIVQGRKLQATRQLNSVAHDALKIESNRLAKELRELGAAPKLKHMTLRQTFGYNNLSKQSAKEKAALNAAKIACGWRPQGLFRRLGPSKHSTGDCATEDRIKGTLQSAGGIRRKHSKNRTRRGRK